MPVPFDFAEHVEKMQAAYTKMKASRDREAVYPFLQAIYRAAKQLKRAGTRKAAEDIVYADCPEHAGKPIIRALIDKVSGDSAAQRSKWYRALRYCFYKDVDAKRLRTFMREKGGINGCADLWAKQGRKKKTGAL